MRRADREVRGMDAIDAIIKQCKTCHVAMIDGDMPYVVPLSFGYALQAGLLTLYFHCAKEGRKLDILRKNNRVCFELCSEGEPVFAAATPCSSGYYYSSVMGFGHAEFVEGVGEKRRALSLLMERQARLPVDFTAEQADTVCVLKIATRDFTGKQKRRPANG